MFCNKTFCANVIFKINIIRIYCTKQIYLKYEWENRKDINMLVYVIRLLQDKEQYLDIKFYYIYFDIYHNK